MVETEVKTPTPLGPANLDALEAPPLSLSRMAWLRFKRHKMALVGTGILFALVMYCVGGALFVPESYANFNDTSIALQSPSWEHPFGTDTIGRDILARTIYGGQISIMIGLTAVLLEVTVGILIGAMAGYFGGWIDNVLMRFTEVILIIPQIFLLLVMARFFSGDINTVKILGREFSGSVIVIVVIIGLTSWPYLARIVRAEFLTLKEHEFLLAARAIGTPTRGMIFRHILPNSMAPIIVSATLGVASAITSGGVHQLPGFGRAAPHGDLGQHARRRLSLYRDSMVVVVFPRHVHPADCTCH